MRVLLAAEESAGIQALRAVAKHDCELVAVMTSAPEGTRRGTVVSDVARQLDVPVWPAAYVEDPALGARMRDEAVDLLLNVHSLRIAHSDVVAAPRIGSFNLHPGPLPHYAGLNAPSWAIVNGETRHAVTLHRMEAGLDAGAIAYEDWFDLAESDTGLSVSMQCVRRGIPLVRQLLETASRDPSAIPSQKQDLSRRRTYRKQDIPHGGRLEWTLTAREAVDFVRAADYYPMPSPWGHPRSWVEGREIAVVKAMRTARVCDAPPGTVGHCEAKRVDVAAADEWISLQLVQVDEEYCDPAELLREGMRFAGAEPA